MKYVKVLRVIISISFLLMTAVICNGQDRAVALHNGTYFIKITLDDESVYSQRIVVRK